MTSPEDYCQKILGEIAPLSAIRRLDYLHACIVPMLESVGYDLAREVDSKASASLFILIAETDRRLGELTSSLAAPQGSM